MVEARQLALAGNKLLAAAADADLQFIVGHGTRRAFNRSDVMVAAGTQARHAYFIERGIASVVKREGERRTEICLIGHEGFTGAPIIQADGQSPYETFVQTDQLCAIEVGADHLRQIVASSHGFARILFSAIHVQMVQVAENLVSAAWQKITVRLSRWLLMYYDRVGSPVLEVTHEFMAMMIGAERAKVTVALHEIEAAGAISASRGKVVVRDVGKLKTLADSTYGCSESEEKRLRKTSYLYQAGA